MGIRNDRLRKARKEAGCNDAIDAIVRFGWKESTYRHHENGTGGRDVPLSAARKYAKAYKVPLNWLLGIDEDLTSSDGSLSSTTTEKVEVIGATAAGVWKDSVEWDSSQRFMVDFGESYFPFAHRFALKVEGDSMDINYPDGTILDCYSARDVGVQPADGDLVVVERVRGDVREFTLKLYKIDEDGNSWLVSESTKPQFQAPLMMQSTDIDHEREDDEIRVHAYVMNYIKPTTKLSREQWLERHR